MANLKSAINLNLLNACFRTLGEAKVPRENRRRHGENIQTPHRKALVIQTQDLLAQDDSANNFATVLHWLKFIKRP